MFALHAHNESRGHPDIPGLHRSSPDLRSGSGATPHICIQGSKIWNPQMQICGVAPVCTLVKRCTASGLLSKQEIQAATTIFFPNKRSPDTSEPRLCLLVSIKVGRLGDQNDCLQKLHALGRILSEFASGNGAGLPVSTYTPSHVHLSVRVHDILYMYTYFCLLSQLTFNSLLVGGVVQLKNIGL